MFCIINLHQKTLSLNKITPKWPFKNSKSLKKQLCNKTRVWVWAGLIHIIIWLFRADGQIICGWFYPWIQMILRMEFLLCRLGDGLLLGYDLTTNLNIDINTATEILLFSVLFGKILQILITYVFGSCPFSS